MFLLNYSKKKKNQYFNVYTLASYLTEKQYKKEAINFDDKQCHHFIT